MTNGCRNVWTSRKLRIATKRAALSVRCTEVAILNLRCGVGKSLRVKEVFANIVFTANSARFMVGTKRTELVWFHTDTRS
jgi:hypothetical protein